MNAVTDPNPVTQAAPLRPPRKRTSDRFSRFNVSFEGEPVPLVLQHRAKRAERVHTQRTARRVLVLLLCDIGTLAIARYAFHALSNAGPALAGLRAWALAFAPRGALSPLQVSVAVLIGLYVCGNYGEGDRRRDPGQLLAGVTLGLTVNWWSVLWSGLTAQRVASFVGTVLAVWAVITAARLIVNSAVRRVSRRYGRGPRVLVVGSARSAQAVRQLPMFNDATEMRYIGYLDTAPDPAPDAIGPVEDYVLAITERSVDTVIICEDVPVEVARSLVDVADAARCAVLTIPDYFNAPGIEPHVVWRGGNALVQITRPGTAAHQRAAKRVFDVVVSSIALVLLAPLMAVIAAAIRLGSHGPVLFAQTRVGMGGKEFRLFKFRSMVPDAEARRCELETASIYTDARLFKVKDDPRVTPIGHLLRRTSLDELPQLWNVLRGDMSLVGPRPPVPHEVALYAEHHYTRFDVRPGITGPWQVGGRNNITDFEDVMRLETAYIRHWTIWKDLGILVRTIPAVLRMDGAH